MKKSFLLTALAMLAALVLSGCAAAPAAGSQTGGYLTLSVNPEIRIGYNEEGLVTSIEGRNDDGNTIVAGYTDYIGKDCSTVVDELIAQIYAAGFFVEDAQGHRNNVVLQIQPGSAQPSGSFLDDLSLQAQNTVDRLSAGAQVVEISNTDYDPQYATAQTPSPYITMDKAKEIALAHAGINAADAQWDDREFDFDNGEPIFELEFWSGGQEYDYEIHAATGQILSYSISPASTGNTGNTGSTGSSSQSVTMDEAKTIALNHAGLAAGDVQWTEQKLDWDDGVQHYDLSFYADGMEYDYEVHAATGQILKAEREWDDDQPVSSGSSSSGQTITMDEAKTVALNHAGLSAADVRWEEQKLDWDDGVQVYELSFRSGGMEYDYEIHAATGQILQSDREWDD